MFGLDPVVLILFLLLGLFVIAGVVVSGIVLLGKPKPRCTRCTKPLSKKEMVLFLGQPMCEPCENIKKGR